MAQFIAINERVEVHADTVMAVVNSMKTGKETRVKILNAHSIYPEKKEWFSQQNWLNAFKEVFQLLGGMNLFMIGKAVISTAQFPPMRNLHEALQSLDVAYHMNHRVNGQVMFDHTTGSMTEGIGHYHLTEFNAAGKRAVMVCNNPYPSKFDEGIITQLVRKFKPLGARESIKLDTTKETRLEGGDSCTYQITW